MFKPSVGELIIILVIILILFGAKRLPEIARALGRSIKEFKRGTNEIKKDIEEATKDEEKKSS